MGSNRFSQQGISHKSGIPHGALATASTVEGRDEFLLIISQCLGHPETFEQSSDVARFISMLREGSTVTINEVKALLATALSVLALVAEDDVHVQLQDSDDISTSCPMQMDDLGQDRQ